MRSLGLGFLIMTFFEEINQKTIGMINLYSPVWSTIEWAALLISIGALIATFKYKVGMIHTLIASGALGITYFLLVDVV